MKKITLKVVMKWSPFFVVAFAALFLWGEIIAYFVMGKITRSYDESYNAQYDQSSVTTEEDVTYEKASVGKACAYIRGTKNVDEGSCIDAIILAGKVGQGMEQSFYNLLTNRTEHPKMVCFRSEGGDTKSAENIAHVIRERGLDTCLADYIEINNGYWEDTYCTSVCPFMLLAGHSRIALGDTFKIGVHHTGMMMNLPVIGKFAKHTPVARMIFFPPLKPIVESSSAQDKEKHKALLERSNLTDFNDMDYIASNDYPKYAIFTDNNR